MSDMTIEQAAKVYKEIEAEVQEGVIIDCEMPAIINLALSKQLGFAVVLILSIKFEYTSRLFENWRTRFKADCCIIKVKQNQLQLRYNVYTNN